MPNKINTKLPHLRQKNVWTIVPMTPVYSIVRSPSCTDIVSLTISGILTCHQALATSILATSGLAYWTMFNFVLNLFSELLTLSTF
jgi:hypothetical protein